MNDPTIPTENDAPFDIDVKVIDKATGKEVPMPTPATVRPPKAKKPLTGTELAIKEVTAITVDFDKVAAGIAALEKKYKDVVYPVATTKGMDDAKAARMEVRDARYRVQRALSNAKAPLNTLKADITSRANEIIGQLTPLEDPIDEQIKAEEQRIEDEKAAKAEAAAAAAKVIDDRIANMRDLVLHAASGKTAVEIGMTLFDLAGTNVTLEDFGDRAGEAAQVREGVITRLNTIRDHVARLEADQLELAARSEALRIQQEATAAEAKRLKDEEDARRADEAKQLETDRKAIADERAALAVERKAADDAKAAEQKRIDDAAAEAKAAADGLRAARLASIQEIMGFIPMYSSSLAMIRIGSERLDSVALLAKDKDIWGDMLDEAQRAVANVRINLDERKEWLECEEKAAADRVEQQRKTAEEAAARDRLEIAAPRLLAALKAMVHKATKQNWNDQYPEELAEAFAAINEAEGVQDAA